MNLTEREQEIAAMVVHGFSNAEIGRELSVTEKTVKFHLTNVYAKLGVTSRAQLIIKSLKRTKGDDDFFKLMSALLK